MGRQEPRDHHYAPQFYLRNFAADPARRKIAAVAKNGHVAVWSHRSIERLGFERDFYVHLNRGVPISVETTINRRFETPISASETWEKVTSGRADALDKSDRPILYALIRHLHSRTPHARDTMRQLAEMAGSPDSEIAFSLEERSMYNAMRILPGGYKAYMNLRSASLDWAANEFESCLITVLRSPIPLKTSTTPVLAIKVPAHPALSQPLPGMTPHILVLPLAPYTLVTLAIGDFGGAFLNQVMSPQEAQTFNLQYVGQFAFFDNIRHLITSRDGLIEELTWAPYDFVEENPRKVVFRRRSER